MRSVIYWLNESMTNKSVQSLKNWFNATFVFMFVSKKNYIIFKESFHLSSQIVTHDVHISI